MAKVLVLAGDAAEDLETMFVKYRLVEAGHEPYVAAPTTRPIKLVVHDFEPDFDTYVEKPGRTCPVDIAFADVDPGGFAALVIPGGRAPEFIRVDPDVRRIVEHFFAEEKPVGTLCHGPQVPAAFGLLRGRRSSGFGPLAPDIELAGAEYVDGAAVVDGNMVSCRGWGDLAEWSRAFLDVLDRSAVPA
jgi:deglycase